MKTENYLREIRDIFAHLAIRTKLDNNNGYSDLNKYAELLFMSIFGHIYDKEFKQFTKVNYPGTSPGPVTPGQAGRRPVVSQIAKAPTHHER